MYVWVPLGENSNFWVELHGFSASIPSTNLKAQMKHRAVNKTRKVTFPLWVKTHKGLLTEDWGPAAGSRSSPQGSAGLWVGYDLLPAWWSLAAAAGSAGGSAGGSEGLGWVYSWEPLWGAASSPPRTLNPLHLLWWKEASEWCFHLFHILPEESNTDRTDKVFKQPVHFSPTTVIWDTEDCLIFIYIWHCHCALLFYI